MLPSQQLKGHWITNTLNILGPGNKELVFLGLTEYLTFCVSPPSARLFLCLLLNKYAASCNICTMLLSNFQQEVTQDALDPLITQLSEEFATSEETESRMRRQVPLKDSNLNLGSRTRKSVDLIFSLPKRQHLTGITLSCGGLLQ